MRDVVYVLRLGLAKTIFLGPFLAELCAICILHTENRCGVNYHSLTSVERGGAPIQIAFAFKRLKEIPREEGGAKKKHGGDRKSEAAKNQARESPHLIQSRARTDADAAAKLGVSEDVARACETVFTTPNVPEKLKAAVNSGKVAPTTAAKVLRRVALAQGGDGIGDEGVGVLPDLPVEVGALDRLPSARDARLVRPEAAELRGEPEGVAPSAGGHVSAEDFDLLRRLCHQRTCTKRRPRRQPTQPPGLFRISRDGSDGAPQRCPRGPSGAPRSPERAARPHRSARPPPPS